MYFLCWYLFIVVLNVLAGITQMASTIAFDWDQHVTTTNTYFDFFLILQKGGKGKLKTGDVWL